tara:strand:+ start:1402 stop:1623 length:222 start_codon:yes stop_codon:yes gene_type:complete
MSKHKSAADHNNTDPGRRLFIKAMGVAGGAVAAVAVAGEASAEVEEASSQEPKASQGYQETDHVRAYYQSARI